MKRIMMTLALVLMATSLWGQEAAAPKKPVKHKARATTTAAKTEQPAVTAEDVRALRDALSAQQQQIQELRHELQQRDQDFRAAQGRLDQATSSASDAQAKATAAQTAADEQKQTYTKLSSDVKDIQGNMTTAALQSQEEQKKFAALEGIVGRFRFSGDVRVRQEDFFQNYGACPSGGASCNPRARERIRARLGIESKLGEDFSAGIFLASGAITDPTSTNETLTNVFERKTISIDRGYVTYNPHMAKWLTLTGGKFAYTWIRTPGTFDNDLNPEGFSEKASFDVHGSSLLKNVIFTGMQLLYNEVNRPSAAASCVAGTVACVNAGTTTGGDSFAAGGQISAKLQFGKRWSLVPSYSILNWRNNDVILNESAATAGAQGAFAPNGITNATVTMGTIGGVAVRSYYSKYLYSDLILDNNISTGWKKLPNWRVLLEYLDNLNAQDHPLAANGTVATTLGRQSHLYKVETALGQQKAKGDWMFTYGFWRQEQDSVLASFDESDQRAPTNVLQHTFAILYRVRNNTTLSYTQWIGRTLNSGLQNAVVAPGIAAGAKEPYLKRAQFDVVYSF